jgi:SAM-dependent methyltransferase
MRSTRARASNRRTIQSYTSSAQEYNRQVSARPPRYIAAALRRMMTYVPAGGLVLEVGSGTGRDADFIESLGGKVRRTDATQAFLDLQAERGKHGERLNLLTDTLGGPYHAILAICVLIHIERAHTDRILRKIRRALRPGGAFLASVWEGAGQTDGRYHMTYWSRTAFAARLTAAGLTVEWDSRRVARGGDMLLTFLARRPPEPTTFSRRSPRRA